MLETKGYTKNLNACFQLFMRKGIRSVSIEDIVRNCDLSKKEIYDVFGNKEGVIQAVMLQDIENVKQLFLHAAKESKNAIEEMLLVHQQLMKRLSKVNPVLFFDLKKFYSETCRSHSKQKQALIYTFIENNLKRGIKDGIYRQNINQDVVTKLWISKMDIIKDQYLFPLQEYDLNDLTHHFTELHLRSVVNSKGYQLLNQYFSIEQE